jgi:hypothetical protein
LALTLEVEIEIEIEGERGRQRGREIERVRAARPRRRALLPVHAEWPQAGEWGERPTDRLACRQTDQIKIRRVYVYV